MKIYTAHELYPALKQLLGLPEYVVSFDLHADISGIVSVDCRYYPVADDGRIAAMGAVFAEYELIPRRSPVPKATEQPIHFDTWMRDRTEARHADYMARHSAGGRAYR